MTISDTMLDEKLGGTVGAILRDDSGTADVAAVLSGLAGTEFEVEVVDRILSTSPNLEDWRIGEAIAEDFLVEMRACEFPWPAGRDLKNPSASPAGTDLVGFQQDASSDLSDDDGPLDTRFAFGEVKTSEQDQYPPSVLRGRHGLIAQIERLRSDVATVDALVKYLAHHANGAPWFGKFKKAAKRYLKRRTDVGLFGVLVRDVSPSEEDLRARCHTLGSASGDRKIELFAFYLSGGSIADLPDRFARIGATQ